MKAVDVVQKMSSRLRATLRKKKLEIMKDAILELHFHPKWFEYGFLPALFFEQQLERYRRSRGQKQGEDDEDWSWQSTKHYRFRAFQTIVDSRKNFSDEQFSQYIELCEWDEDQAMALSVLINLLPWPGLTSEQFARLAEHPALDNSLGRKLIWRNRMSAVLFSDNIPETAFLEIVEKQDSVFERRIADSWNISRQQLEVLAEKGSSRAIRNVAKSRLRRQK